MKIKKFKLIQLGKDELGRRQQNVLRGGGNCEKCWSTCACGNCSCPVWDGTDPISPESSWNSFVTNTNQNSLGNLNTEIPSINPGY